MSIVKQVLLALLILVLGSGGVLWYYQANVAAVTDPAGERGGRPAAPVIVTTAESEKLERRVEAVGTTRARQSIEIVPETVGRIAEISFEAGETVEAGDVLVRLRDEIERADLEEAEAALREVELALDRARRLRENNTVAQAQVDELEAQRASAVARRDRARERLDQRLIKAPFAGVVGLRRIDLGAHVDSGAVVTTLDDLSEVEVAFSLPQNLFGQISKGQPVVATSTAFPDRTFDGRIVDIDSRVDPTSRSFRVRAALPNPDLVLPAGMFVHLRVILGSHEAVTVPEEAISAEADATYIYVVEDGRAEKREVEIGLRRVGMVEIREGLNGGELVVIEGLQRMRDGAAVRIAGERAHPARGSG